MRAMLFSCLSGVYLRVTSAAVVNQMCFNHQGGSPGEICKFIHSKIIAPFSSILKLLDCVIKCGVDGSCLARVT